MTTQRRDLLRLGLTTAALLLAAPAWADPPDPAAVPNQAPEVDAAEAGAVVRLTAEGAPGVTATRGVADLAFDWGDGAPDPRLPADGFRLDAEGLLLVQAPGSYRFLVRGDGTTSLRVNGVGVSDGKPVELAAGFVPWALTYRHGRGPARLAVDWEGPGFAREPVPARLLFHDPTRDPPADRFEHGRRLADRLGCANCHDLLDLPGHPTLGPPLDAAARLVEPGWLASWVKDPSSFRPTTPMPGFGHGLRDGDAADLAAFLARAGSKPVVSAEVRMALNVATPERGQLLFRSVGCLGCHALGAAPGPEPAVAPDLAAVSRKRTPEELASYLEHPRTGKTPSRHRPDLRLSADDAAQLAAYLAGPRKAPGAPAGEPPGDAKRGRVLAGRLRCAACHEIPGLGRPEKAAPLHAGSDPRGGCLAEPGAGARAEVPRYALSAEARGALRAFVAGLPERPSPTSLEVIASDAVRRRNCLGCHARDGQGGRDLAGRLAPLLAEDPALGGLKGTLTPPNLTAVGDKLRPEYLGLAVRGEAPTARPWLSVRMPAFAFEPGEADAIASLFRRHDRTRAGDDPPPPSPPTPLAPEARESAARLIGQKGFGCVSCHVLDGRIPPGGEPETLGPDLALAHRRMTERYFRRWIADPQRVIAGTPMPQFLKPVEGVPGTLDYQLSAIWRLLGSPDLAEVAASGTREVLRREGDRALVVRDMVLVPGLPGTPYTPRGLALGFKNDTSALFDTDRLGWLASWKGGFLARTKSGRLWEWHPEGTPLWTAGRRLPPVVVVEGGGAVRPPTEVRERFGSFRLLEFTGDGVRLAYRLNYDDAPVDVTEEVRPAARGWRRVVRVAAGPKGGTPALVAQGPESARGASGISWRVGADRVRLTWDDRAGALAYPGAPGAAVVPLAPAAGGGFEGGVTFDVAPSR